MMMITKNKNKKNIELCLQEHSTPYISDSFHEFLNISQWQSQTAHESEPASGREEAAVGALLLRHEPRLECDFQRARYS